MILIVTGSRSITDPAEFEGGLAHACSVLKLKPDEIAGVLHGGAQGWDALAAEWAQRNLTPDYAIPYEDGAEEGLARVLWGKRRNWLMLDRTEGRNRVLLAGWDGYSGGTAHMMAAAAVRSVCVIPWVVTG